MQPVPPSKRILDIILALVILTLSAPLCALITIAIKLEDGGPLFYGQDRVGRGGELFRSWKFRSMSQPREREGPERQAAPGDPRVTRVGRLLRARAMDELPQLWSILRGDMSFVGPRALLPEEEHWRGEGVTRLMDIEGFEERHSVLPGLTGVAQVYGARDLPPRQKFRYDLLYVEKRSFCLDFRLILLSIWISLRAAWPRIGRDGEVVTVPTTSPAAGRSIVAGDD